MCRACVPSPVPLSGNPSNRRADRASRRRRAFPRPAAFLPSDIEQLQIRIEAADTHLMRLQHLYEIGSSIVANTPGNWPGLDALQWVFDLQRERIAWARETLITDDERETTAFRDTHMRLLAPQSVQEA